MLAAAYHIVRHRKLPPTYVRFFAGAALGAALLIPAGMAVVGRASTYQDFVRNTMKHSGTALTNNMGLRTVVAYRPSEAGRMMRNEGQTDPWAKWKQARLDSFHRSKPVYFVAVAAFLALLCFAVRDVEPWAVLALSATFIPFGVELTCYYYAFLIVVALLCLKNERFASRLLLLTAFTQFVAWAPVKGMPTWLDEQYTLMSVATIIVFITIAWDFVAQRRLALASRGCLRRAGSGCEPARRARSRRPRPPPPPAAVGGLRPDGEGTQLTDSARPLASERRRASRTSMFLIESSSGIGLGPPACAARAKLLGQDRVLVHWIERETLGGWLLQARAGVDHDLRGGISRRVPGIDQFDVAAGADELGSLHREGFHAGGEDCVALRELEDCAGQAVHAPVRVALRPGHDGGWLIVEAEAAHGDWIEAGVEQNPAAHRRVIADVVAGAS